MHDDELEDAVPEVGLVVVCSQEIDETAEAGKLAASFTAFDHIVGLISRAVARLAHRGVRSFVVTADHGFIALSHDVGPHMIIAPVRSIIDKPAGPVSSIAASSSVVAPARHWCGYPSNVSDSRGGFEPSSSG